MKNGRLIIAILTSLLDEALIIAAILWGLPRLGISIPLYGTILVCVGFVIYAVLIYIMGSRALIKQPVKGFTDLIGMEGRVAVRLGPEGTVRIAGEIWDARSDNGDIEAGTRVEVINQKGFKLIVCRRFP